MVQLCHDFYFFLLYMRKIKTKMIVAHDANESLTRVFRRKSTIISYLFEPQNKIPLWSQVWLLPRNACTRRDVDSTCHDLRSLKFH